MPAGGLVRAAVLAACSCDCAYNHACAPASGLILTSVLLPAAVLMPAAMLLPAVVLCTCSGSCFQLCLRL